ncbi:MAG: UDP-N-acetylmuramate dehydrogenase [Lachnospiraceae bacterium]|nr:UDP-N-acetylmuramate dehydrogenase [Lachnospiraceae bacterium]
MVTEKQKQLLSALYGERGIFREKEPMAPHTTFRIGGPAEVYLVPADEEQLAATVRLLRGEGMRWQILGNGSNVLVADEGIGGVLIHMEDKKSVPEYRTESGMVLATVTAGMSLSGFARDACERGLADMEYATGIPGTVGGGVVMNAGAYEGEIRHSLREVSVITADGERRVLSAAELKLSYRYSIIPEKGYLVTGATFGMKEGDRDAIRAKVLELSARRREKQPLEYPSAGSTFKRPAGYYAGKLIEEAGLRGYTVGGAQVSEKHCGFVINRGGATCADVKKLIADVQRIVLEKSGVKLEPEVKFLS